MRRAEGGGSTQRLGALWRACCFCASRVVLIFTFIRSFGLQLFALKRQKLNFDLDREQYIYILCVCAPFVAAAERERAKSNIWVK